MKLALRIAAGAAGVVLLLIGIFAQLPGDAVRWAETADYGSSSKLNLHPVFLLAGAILMWVAAKK